MNENQDLSQFPFFSGISRERLAEIESLSMVQTFTRGNTVFRNNEPARNLYALAEGQVSLSILFREDIVTREIRYEDYIRTNIETLEKPVVIENIKAKDIFGWSALVEPERMTATATCEKDCEILLFPASDLRRVFNTDPKLGYLLCSRLNSLIARRLNSRTERLVNTWCSLFETEKISTV